MAAPAEQKTVNVTINGTKLSVPSGELLVESVKRLGLEIPIFCYHPRMEPVGMCRMCLVEVGFEQQDGSVRMMPKPQAGCTLGASEGMVVVTDTESIHADRKGVLEFLLINHPLDCPICDRGGECPLQNNTMAYGPSTSRFKELKRHLPKAFPLSRHVTLDLERCIQCGRCVRFTEEISGDADLAFRFRGAEMQPSTFQLSDFDSRFSGNVIEICPVGALTSTDYRFRARPWDLEAGEGICTQCSNGCSVWVDRRSGKFVRINGRTNDEVNEEWTCDKGKFGHEYLNSPERATTPMVRKGDALVACTWQEAYETIASEIGKGTAASLVGERVSNEAMWMHHRLFHQKVGSADIDFRWTRHLPPPDAVLRVKTGPKAVQGTIAALEDAEKVVILGTHLAEDLPIVHLRVRKAWTRNGVDVAVAFHGPTEAETFSSLSLRYQVGEEATLVKALLSAAVENGASVPDAVRSGLAEYSPEAVAGRIGGSAAQIRDLAARFGEGTSIVASDVLLDRANAQEAYEDLAGLAKATGSMLHLFPRGANAMGAEALGLLPGSGAKDTWQIVQAATAGALYSLWLVEAELADVPGGATALENVPFLVVQTTTLGETARYASVVLPMAAPPEQDGTWTNCEGRVQRMVATLRAPGEAKPAWRIACDLSLMLGGGPPYFSAAEVMEAIADESPSFGGCVYSSLPDEGAVLDLSSVPTAPLAQE
ncbi:MAG: NADH-quinone oxidoreductase subunit NuoG [Fimbriimonadaceae bacterium]